MKNRIDILRKKLESINLKSMIITNEKNIYYLTGIDVKGILLITLQDNIFLTFDRYISHVQNILTVDARVIVISIEKCRNFKEFLEEEKKHSLNVGIEENSITIKEYEQYVDLFGVRLVKTNDIIEKMRSIKDEEEIEEIINVSKKLNNCLKNIEDEFSVRNERNNS